MSELINANPSVKNAELLPRRASAEGSRTVRDRTRGYLEGLVGSLTFSDGVPQGTPAEKGAGSEPMEELVDAQEIFDLISSISDPEHPLTLGQLSVVNLSDIRVEHPDLAHNVKGLIAVEITPTITHCSLATLIGLGIRVRLQRSTAETYRISVKVKPGTHQSENQVNKQLNDKERVAAACENPQLENVVGKMLITCRSLTE